MKKRNGKTPKPRLTHDAYELPDELDFTRLRYVGRGLSALERYVAEKNRTIVLDEDVARAFPTAKHANQALRELIRNEAVASKKRKRSA